MRVSHETIYRSRFVQGRGALRRELTRCLRSGRAQRRPQRRHGGGELKDMVLLSDRPAGVADRAVPGHWEGDLILGQGRPLQLAERLRSLPLPLPAAGDDPAILAERIESYRRAVTDAGVEIFERLFLVGVVAALLGAIAAVIALRSPP